MSAEVAAAATALHRPRRLPLALRLAMRELRSGLSGFTVFMLCIALGVASIAGIGSLAGALQTGLERQGQEILGGDVTLELVHRRGTAEQRDFIAARGTSSEIAVLRAMARPAQGGSPAMVQIKAIDGAYPLYGRIKLAAPGATPPPTTAVLRQTGTAAVDPILLSRLGLKVGDSLRIGTADIRIVATVESEPDRLAGRLEFGPRVLMSIATLETTGLIQPGSLINWRYLLGLERPDAAALQAVRAQVNERFPDGGFQIRDRRDPSPRLRRAIDHFAQFLTLIGITTLLIGGVGVANAISTYLARKRETIAAFKCLGAGSGIVFTTYLVQILLLAGAGTALGLAVGALLPVVIAALYGDALPVALALDLQPLALAFAALYGLLTALLFVLWPLGLARDIKPALLLRQTVSGERRLPRWTYIAASVICALGLGGLAVASADRKLLSAYAVLGIAAVFVVYFGFGFLIERMARRLPRPRIPELALARSNLAGPGALGRTVVLSLGASLSLLAGVAVVNTSLTAELAQSLPDNAPSYFILDIAQDQKDRLETLVHERVPGAALHMAPMLRGRIVEVKDTPAEEVKAGPEARWVLNGDRGLTYSDTVPEGSTLVKGEWWPKDYDGPPLVSFEAEIANGLGLAIGDTVTVNVLGRNVVAKVANLREVDWESLSINFVMVFSRNALAGAPFNLLATVGLPRDLPAETEGRMVQTLVETFPAITAIRVRDALDSLKSVLDRVMVAIRAAGGLTLITGAVVLAGALATAQRRRVREAVIFKTLGATRRRIVTAHLIECTVLAFLTGVAALGLGTLGAYLALKFAMDSEFTFSWPAVLQALGFAVALVLAFGAVGTWRTLSARPAQYLRAG